MYAQLRGRPFLPRMAGFSDDGERPVLAIEDLSDASWPPPWDRTGVDAVLACLDEVHAAPPPPDVPGAERHEARFHQAWRDVAARPGAVPRARPLRRRWLDEVLPTFAEATAGATAAGASLLHWDVRSDNLCLRDGRALLIDWNWACVGNPRWDLAFWLPSLAAEGGPAPASVMQGDDVPAARRRRRRLLLRPRRASADPSRPRTCASCSCSRRGPRCPGRPVSWDFRRRREPQAACTCKRSLHCPVDGARTGRRRGRQRRRDGAPPRPGPAHDPAAPGDRGRGHADRRAHLAHRDRAEGPGRDAGRERVDGVPDAGAPGGGRRPGPLASGVRRRVPPLRGGRARAPHVRAAAAARMR